VFAPAGEEFSVALPTQPVFALQPVQARGNTVTNQTFTVETGPASAFAVSVLHIPEGSDPDAAGLENLYGEGIRSALRQIEGTLVYQTNVVISGREGIEARMKGLKDNRAIITTRLVLDGQKLLQANCVMPKESLCEEHVRKFLDSFTLASNSGVATTKE
jgi:hypothetical protein